MNDAARTLPEIQNRPIPQEILGALKSYWRFGNATQWGMFWLAIIAFIASLMVTSFDKELINIQLSFVNINLLKLIAFIAALCSGLIGLLNLPSKTKDVWAAWRMLNSAVLRYKYDQEFTLKQLLEAYVTAESTIGNITINTK